MFYTLFKLRDFNGQTLVFGIRRWFGVFFPNSMAFFFLSGLRHITILKLLGIGEEIGGVLELFPINGTVLLFYNN